MNDLITSLTRFQLHTYNIISTLNVCQFSFWLISFSALYLRILTHLLPNIKKMISTGKMLRILYVQK